MGTSVRKRVFGVATCFVCLALSAASAGAQLRPATPPKAAPAAPPKAPASAQPAPAQPAATPAQVAPAPAPAAAPADPPPTAAQPAPQQLPPPPAAQPQYPPPAAGYAYPPPGTYPPGAYPPGAYPPGAYAYPGTYPPPQYAPAYDRRAERERIRAERRAERRNRPSRGMLIAGAALFAGGYLPPAIIGLGIGTQDRSQCDCREALRLLIPIAGPLTLWKPNKDFNFFFNTLMVLDSLVQTTGVVLTVFGIMRYNQSVREAELGKVRKHPALTFGATPLPGGAYGSLRLQL